MRRLILLLVLGMLVGCADNAVMPTEDENEEVIEVQVRINGEWHDCKVYSWKEDVTPENARRPMYKIHTRSSCGDII